MKTLLFLLEKEFRQMMRIKGIFPQLLIGPVIQLVLLPLAATFTIKNISIAVVDHDHSTYSRKLIDKIAASGYFKLTDYTASYQKALFKVEQDKADLILQIPVNFEKKLVRENSEKIFIAINAIDGTKATLGGAYLNTIISNFNAEIRDSWPVATTASVAPRIIMTSSSWYNPYMNYLLFLVPGILVSLISNMIFMQSALNIVKEKEDGTIEQMNVSPVKKHIFIIGKIIPFIVLGSILFTVGLFISWLFHHIIPAGSILLLYLALICFLFAILGIGLLVSTYSSTQQQAMAVCFFITMVFQMMGGVYVTIDSMPHWAMIMVEGFPPSHFIKIMRMVVIKGSGFIDISYHLMALVMIGLVASTWAVFNYRKTTG